MITQLGHDQTTTTVLGRIVALGLGGSSNETFEVLPNETWRLLFRAAHEHRVMGLLAFAVYEGFVSTSASQLAEVSEAHAALLRLALHIENGLLEVLEILDQVRVEPIVMKGVATAHLDYMDPALRPFQDVDVLVPNDCVDVAVRALARSGLTRDLPQRRPGWDARFSKEITFKSQVGLEVDFHRLLVTGAFGFWMDLDDLTESPDSFGLGGRRILALSPECRALQAAYCLTVGEATPRLSHAADLAAVLAGRVDWPRLAVLSGRWRSGPLVAEALNLTAKWLGEATIPEAAKALRHAEPAPFVERLARRCYETARGSNTTNLLSGVLGLSNTADRLAYLRGLVTPSQGYKASRRRAGRPSELSTGLRELLRRHSQ